MKNLKEEVTQIKYDGKLSPKSDKVDVVVESSVDSPTNVAGKTHTQRDEPSNECETVPSDNYYWCFNIGANVHVSSVREDFVTYDGAPVNFQVSGISAGSYSTVVGIGTILIVKATFHDGMWGLTSSRRLGYDRNAGAVMKQSERPGLADYSTADRQASMKLWHQRLEHTCDQYLKIMADQEHVDASLIAPEKTDCKISAPNQVVYLTTKLLTQKKAATLNPLMKAYVSWAERKAGRSIKKIIVSRWEPTEGTPTLPVHKFLTDKGGKFVNADIDLCGASALVTRSVGCMPFEKLFGTKPDFHHICKFGSLAMCMCRRIQIGHDTQTTQGCVFLGLKEDNVGYKVFSPAENTRKWSPDVQIDESILYGDRYRRHDPREAPIFSSEDPGNASDTEGVDDHQTRLALQRPY
ncbi:unnamed protein product [Peronospora belbahrii]|uniref:GAG-pre-integrase domain-containing protein n=1 Tax=Peronospora belbahrii TaxID=622444 RepID=A0AAU9L857_9STRA|nr:unnamed protein product [Peronospora belbahrii]